VGNEEKKLNRSKKPDYQLAKEKILALIIDGDYRPGDAIPSVSRLSEQLKLGRISIQKAVGILKEEGILKNIPGSGCYLQTLRSSSNASSINLPGEISRGSCRKTIKVGILNELPTYYEMWTKVFKAYTDRHPEILIELIGLPTFNTEEFWKIHQEVDIVQIHSYLLPYYIKQKIIFPPSELGTLKLDKQAYYIPFIEGSEFNGQLWGVPMAASTTCLFYNCEYEQQLEKINSINGLWNGLNFFEKLSATSPLPICAGNHSIYIFKMMAGTGKYNDYDEVFNFDKQFTDFLHSFEKFYLNPEIFPPPPLENHDMPSSFFTGSGMTVFGAASWTSDFMKQCTFKWGFLPNLLEPNGAAQAHTNLNCISNTTPYPEECLEIINYLGQPETQKILSSYGRLTASREANQEIKWNNFNYDTLNNLHLDLDNSKIVRTDNPYLNEYITTLFDQEIRIWQDRQCSIPELMDSLKKKTRFFQRGMMLRHQH
jgi:DNA-binding transcriptional regulator YhcF (GntR family)/ABC-type glycerol-3-phosphate transport system substrate-binding protein